MYFVRNYYSLFSIIHFFLFLNLNVIFPQKTQYSEELLVSPLRSKNDFLFSFVFSQNYVNDTSGEYQNFGSFPINIAEIILDNSLEFLSLSLTQGRWLYESWGPHDISLPISPNGVQLSFRVSPFRSLHHSVKRIWLSVTESLSSLFCSSLTQLHPYTWKPVYEKNHSNDTTHNFSFKNFPNNKNVEGDLFTTGREFFGSSAREDVCIENLNPILSLLPCSCRFSSSKTKNTCSGISSILYPSTDTLSSSSVLHFRDFSYYSVNIRAVSQINEDTSIREISLTISFNIVKEYSLDSPPYSHSYSPSIISQFSTPLISSSTFPSISQTFGHKLFSIKKCPFSSKSYISWISLNNGKKEKDSLFILKNNEKKKDNEENKKENEKENETEIYKINNNNKEKEKEKEKEIWVSNVKDDSAFDIFLPVNLSRNNEETIFEKEEIKFSRSISSSEGDDRSYLSFEILFKNTIMNEKDKTVKCIILVPWYFRVFFHSLLIQFDEMRILPSQIFSDYRIQKGLDYTQPSLIEFDIILSQLRSFINNNNNNYNNNINNNNNNNNIKSKIYHRMTFHYIIEKAYLSWTQHAPDTHRGYEFPSSYLFVYSHFLNNNNNNNHSSNLDPCQHDPFLLDCIWKNENENENEKKNKDRSLLLPPLINQLINNQKEGGTRRIQKILHTEPMLVPMPTVDFSMPYNVITMVGTIYGLMFIGIFNQTFQRLDNLKKERKVKKEKLLGKLFDNIKTKLFKKRAVLSSSSSTATTTSNQLKNKVD